MRKKKNPVKLQEEEVAYLRALIGEKNTGSHIVKRANILLMLDESMHPCAKVSEIMCRLRVSGITVSRVAERYNKEGLDRALRHDLSEARRSMIKIDEAVQMQIITIASAPPPKGTSRWTLLMIRDKLIEMKMVDSITPESVRQVLKKWLAASPD
jgi:transposase